jgi:RecA-family ATPase
MNFEGKPMSELTDSELSQLKLHEHAAQLSKGVEILPRAWTATELLATEFPEPHWVVPKLIPAGTTVIGGAPKVGKSWLCLHLGLTIAHGGFAFGTHPVMPQTILYLALEDTPRRLKQRLKILGAEPSDRFLLTTEWSREHSAPAQLAAWKREYPEISILIVDTLARIAQPGDMRETNYERDYRQIAALKAMADKLDVSVIGVTHTRKMPAEDFLHTLSGSVGVTAASDTIVALTRERRARDGLLQITGRDVDEQSLALAFNAEVGSWTIVGDSDEVQKTTERQLIYDTLQEAEEPMNPKTVAKEADLPEGSVRHLLRKMKAEGAVVSPAYGKYTIPPSEPLHSVHSIHSPENDASTVNRVNTVNDFQGV